MNHARSVVTFLAGLAVAALAGCSGTADQPASGTTSDPINLTVHSATSLTNALPEITEAFVAAEAAGGSVIEVELIFGGSSGLATSITEGARSNVFVSANSQVTSRLVDAGVASSSTVIAFNDVALVVPPGDPAQIAADFANLNRAAVARCAPEVPCGALALRTLAELGLEITPRTEERNVRAVLAKVELGEVDAGFVYQSDAQLSGDKVTVIDLGITEPLVTDYSAVVIRDQLYSDQSQRFIAFLTTQPAQEILASHGFTRL